MAVYERVRQLIAESGIPQAEVARRSGLDRQWLNKRLLGAAPLDVEAIPAIARVLHVPCSAFFTDSDCSELSPNLGVRERADTPAPSEARAGGGDTELFLREFMREWMRMSSEERKELTAFLRIFRERVEESPTSTDPASM